MKLIVYTIVALTSFACASSKIQKLKEYPAKEEYSRVDVYMDKKDISKSYETICLIKSKTGQTLLDKKTVSSAIEIAKRKARQCGADAIIILSSEKKGISLWSYGKGQVMAEGIRYK